MPVTKVLARNTKFFILDDTDQRVEIKGINSFTIGMTKNDADTTSFEDGGNETHLVASRGQEFTLDGYRLEDVDTGERDPGQQLVEVLATLIGPPSIGEFVIVYPSGWEQPFTGSVSVTPAGGGNNDPNAWSVTLTVSGGVVPAVAPTP